MSVQTTYKTYHGRAFKGMPADLQLCNTVSRLNATGSNIPYGKGVVTDDTAVTGDDTRDTLAIRLPVAGDTEAASIFNGVLMRELNQAFGENEAFGLQDKRTGTVVSTGVIWVMAVEDVAKDDPVFLRIGATDAGDFSNAAGTGATLSVEIPGAKWLNDATAGNLAKISLTIGG